MAIYKYLSVDPTTAQPTETYPITATSGTGNAGQIIATNAAGMIDPTFIANTNAASFTASEAISAGALINIWNNSGTPNVRNADSSVYTKRADGYMPSAVISGAVGSPVLREGINSGLTGLTPGANYFLGSTGGITLTAPSGTNSIIQNVGIATNSTSLSFFADYRLIIRQ